jgi:hypothetical protein
MGKIKGGKTLTDRLNDIVSFFSTNSCSENKYNSKKTTINKAIEDAKKKVSEQEAKLTSLTDEYNKCPKTTSTASTPTSTQTPSTPRQPMPPENPIPPEKPAPNRGPNGMTFDDDNYKDGDDDFKYFGGKSKRKGRRKSKRKGRKSKRRATRYRR